jgi:tRNA A-37 threonylcarbamoyl transferase component Bud32
MTPMAAPISGEKFIDTLRRSGLISEASLAGYAEQPSLASNAQALAAALIKAGLLTPFQAKLLLAGKYRGLVLGNYKILDQIGRGGMGTVYLAEHTSLKRKAAVKVLGNDHAGTAIGMERFYREAQSAAALDHPNIVKVYDVGQFGNVHYIAMEYVEGQTLAQMIEKNGPLHHGTAADYVAQAAAGLQDAADKGFVHRDIKPENLIVDRAGVVKILDMGLTRPTDDSASGKLTSLIDPDSVVGTPDYIAPEQALNLPVDIRTDIYSLGVTFFAILAGKPPFSGTTAQKLLQHQMKEAPSLSSLRAKVPPEMGDVIRIMMAKKPADRYQSPGEVIDALSPWLAEGALSAPTTTRPAGGSRTRATTRGRITQPIAAAGPPRRNWLIPVVASVLAFLVVACVGVVVSTLMTGDKSKGNLTAQGTSKNGATPVPDPAAPPLPDVRTLPPLPAGALLVAAEGPEPRFASIAAALETVKPGDKALIVVRSPVVSEHLTLTAKHSGTTIESGFPDSQVTWLVPANAADKPLLELNGVEGVRVKGFKFDGQGRVSDAVAVRGKCPDTTLEDATLVGFSRAGVSLTAAAGFEERPVTLKKLRAHGITDAGSGVLFDAGAPSSYVKVLDCRFEGPLANGITVSGPALNVEIRRNRFFRVRAGIHYLATTTPVGFTGTVRNNTFAEVPAGLAFAAVPATAGPLAVTDNLFLSTGHLAMLAGTPLAPPESPGWYWSPEKSMNIPAEPRFFRRVFEVTAKPAQATLNIGVDESFTVWLNGKEVGKSTTADFAQRVYAFDVTKELADGKNVLAIEGNNKLDPFNNSFATAAAFVVKLTATDAAGKETTLTTSDDPWKCAKVKTPGWNELGFNDSEWVAPKPWAGSELRFPWREPVWDSVADAHWKGRNRELSLKLGGNVRDYESLEGYPVLDSKRTIMVVKKVPVYGNDPADDATFLRYPAGHPLANGATTGGPVGMPPAGQ